MDEIISLLLMFVCIPFALLLFAIIAAVRASRNVRRLESQVSSLRDEVYSLRREGYGRGAAPTSPSPAAPQPPRVPETPPAFREAAPPRREPSPPASAAPAAALRAAAPAPAEAARKAPAIDWEQFMGVKLFAWIGGFALFLALVFFLKYAFEKNLISPEVQVAGEYLLCAGLLVGGARLHLRTRYAVTAQALCATAVLGLYAVTYAAHAYYRLIGIAPCFAVMALTTAAAFLLSVRLDAQVVAALGLLGGFLTPPLLSTGTDNSAGLFGYIALLDIGLIAASSPRRWHHLVLLAAAGTALTQIGWAASFFAIPKVFIAMGVFLGFEALFLAAFAIGERESPWRAAAAVVMAFMPLAFTLYLLTFPGLGEKPWLVFSFVLAADLGALALALLNASLAPVHLAAGAAVFLSLSIWTAAYVSAGLLDWALGFILLFAILHSAFPAVLDRLRPGAPPLRWGQAFPPVALLLVMIPVAKLPEASWAVWFCILAIDAVVFGLAWFTVSVAAILGALALTLATAGMWILKAPAAPPGLPGMLTVIGGFALVLFVLGVLRARRHAPQPPRGAAGPPGAPRPPTAPRDLRAQVPAASAILPFALLIMVSLRVPLADPSPLFGLAMLLVVLLLGVARWTGEGLLGAAGLISTLALEWAWHLQRFDPERAAVPVAWYLAFAAVFTLYPFVFGRALLPRVAPWAVSAAALPLQFPLLHRAVSAAWPNPAMGLLPAACAIPPLAGLARLIRLIPPSAPNRNALLAWFGGAALFFVTLVFPVQFERQWITIGWALEGAALLWLFRRVPHPGLRLAGAGLLCTAFVRLALNPAVLCYHPSSERAILNWYLYAYGITAACLFSGAMLLAPPQHRIGGCNLRALLATLGTVLAFLLVNIEIADYFTAGGTMALTFRFSGDLGRDMTYSIAWAAFALVLLIAGIARRLRPARYASLSLLSVTLLKLFLHDLARLDQIFRIGAFVGVAAVLLASSFLYQRFVPAESEEP